MTPSCQNFKAAALLARPVSLLWPFLLLKKEGPARAGAAIGAAAQARTAGAEAEHVASWPTKGCTMAILKLATSNSSPPACQQFSKRQYSSRAQIWEHLPSRKAQFQEAVTLAELLPHRATYAPQFTPHGIQLIPKAVLQQQQQQQQQVDKGAPAAGKPASMPPPSAPAAATAAKAAPTSTLHQWDAAEDVDGGEERGMQLATDRTKAWRRLKIKKHKVSKRRKANRYKST